MTEIKIYCDHCGKELNEMHDYVEQEVGIVDYLMADLCHKCMNDLESKIRNFVKKEEGVLNDGS